MAFVPDDPLATAGTELGPAGVGVDVCRGGWTPLAVVPGALARTSPVYVG